MAPRDTKTLKLSPASIRTVLSEPTKRFWLIVGLIALGGAVLRVLLHDFGLPWFEERDELRIWFVGRQARGMSVPGVPDRPLPYPPLIIWLHQIAQPLAEARGQPFAAQVTLDLRRVMLLFTIPGTILFALLGRYCGGAVAGIIAATLWAVDVNLLEATIYAIGETMTTSLLLISLLLALRALESPRPWWPAWLSVGLGILCFLGEYRLLVTVIPGCAILVWRAWHHYRPGWRRTLLWATAAAVLVAAAGLLVLQRLPAVLQEIFWQALGTGLRDVEDFVLYLGHGVALVHPVVLPALLVMTLLVLRTRRRSPTAPLPTPPLLLAGATMFLTLLSNSAIRAYGQQSTNQIWTRHLLPPLLMLYLLLATTLAQLWSALRDTLFRPPLRQLLPACLLLLLLLPTLRLVEEYRVVAWPVIVRHYVDDNLEPGTILIYHTSEVWFNPVWGGIPHRKWFDWWPVSDIRKYSLQELIETHKITWALIPVIDHKRLTGSEEGQALLAQMLPLRAFTAPPQRRLAETLLYRLWRMQHETDIRFGEGIRLVGYDLHTPDARPGDELAFTLYWNATATPPENYSFFLHLVAVDDPAPLAQLDGNPAVAVRLTQTWDRPDETLISPRFTLSLPHDLAPGDYRVLLGLYNYETGARLPVRDSSGAAAGDSWELMKLNTGGTADDSAAAD